MTRCGPSGMVFLALLLQVSGICGLNSTAMSTSQTIPQTTAPARSSTTTVTKTSTSTSISYTTSSTEITTTTSITSETATVTVTSTTRTTITTKTSSTTSTSSSSTTGTATTTKTSSTTSTSSSSTSTTESSWTRTTSSETTTTTKTTVVQTHTTSTGRTTSTTEVSTTSSRISTVPSNTSTASMQQRSTGATTLQEQTSSTILLSTAINVDYDSSGKESNDIILGMQLWIFVLVLSSLVSVILCLVLFLLLRRSRRLKRMDTRRQTWREVLARGVDFQDPDVPEKKRWSWRWSSAGTKTLQLDGIVPGAASDDQHIVDSRGSSTTNRPGFQTSNTSANGEKQRGMLDEFALRPITRKSSRVSQKQLELLRDGTADETKVDDEGEPLDTFHKILNPRPVLDIPRADDSSVVDTTAPRAMASAQEEPSAAGGLGVFFKWLAENDPEAAAPKQEEDEDGLPVAVLTDRERKLRDLAATRAAKKAEVEQELNDALQDIDNLDDAGDV